MQGDDFVLAVASMLDAGATDARLEQLARLTAAKYWRQAHDEDWGREATVLFRPASRWLYAVFPIYRRRYYAVVRIDQQDMADAGAIRSDMFEVRGISVFEQDATQAAFAELAEEFV